LWEATFEAVPESPRAAYNLGFVATQQGDHERAIRLYELALERDPTFLPAYRNLASTYGKLKRPDEARAVYERAQRMDLGHAARDWHMTPDQLASAFRVEIALVDARKGETETALAELERIVGEDPDTIRAQDA
ncbi:tetratricopeptide repeat protein, partial [Bradyrhizobium sp. NBAIM08]|uniref:tetratricopeptide repeat protein n=1 Tax=Bradyrhizobium sp. NBAIM08 TaxID=2793815 RepID=UPI001CD47D1C